MSMIELTKYNRALKYQKEAAILERSGDFAEAARLWAMAVAVRAICKYSGDVGMSNHRELNYCKKRQLACQSLSISRGENVDF